MKYRLRIIWNYIEVGFTHLCLFFNIKKDKTVIPKGHYCYIWDDERNKKEPHSGYWVIPCRYYRSMKGQCEAGCTYVGFIGFDVGLGDQCKICGENMDYENE